jgi:flagellin-like protein
MRQDRGEEGVSEVIGVVLLIGVTVLAVAVVTALFLSGPQPDEIPHATIVAGNKSGNLTLAHEGGDPLRKGEYRIYVENESGFVDGTGSFSKPEGGVWSIGGALVYNGTGKLKRVVVTAISGGSETILAEPEFVGRGEGAAGFSPDPVEPGVTVTPGPGTSPSSPVIITNPSIQNPIDWNNESFYNATVDKNATRVDLIIYKFNIAGESNEVRVYNMENTTPETYYQELKIVGKIAQKGDDVAITTIAYNGSKAIGYDTLIVKITN